MPFVVAVTLRVTEVAPDPSLSQTMVYVSVVPETALAVIVESVPLVGLPTPVEKSAGPLCRAQLSALFAFHVIARGSDAVVLMELLHPDAVLPFQ